MRTAIFGFMMFFMGMLVWMHIEELNLYQPIKERNRLEEQEKVRIMLTFGETAEQVMEVMGSALASLGKAFAQEADKIEEGEKLYGMEEGEHEDGNEY